jgi:hypothetical protein
LIFNVICISEVKSKKGDDMSVANSNISTETKCSTSAPEASASQTHDSGIAAVMH